MSTCATMVSSNNGSSEVKKPFERLPKAVVPTHYEIFLRPNLIDLVFKGTIKIDLEVKENTNVLVCNAADLQVQKVEVNGETIDDGNIVLSEAEETLTVKVGKDLAAGSTATMHCAFTGTLNDRMKGFYRSKYTLQGEERFAATTQFEVLSYGN